MRKILLTVMSLVACVSMNAATWGITPDIHVENNYLINSNGEQVMLHGIMDTPSPYFCGYRFTDYHWIDVYNQGDSYINKCITYFDKLFTAATDTKQGSWCNVFRLHLDPCWTDNPNVKASGFKESEGKILDPNGNVVSGEANIRNFDKARLEKYLGKLYLPIAKKAKGHNMYVIMRPPGVCPSKIKVGDYYQKYLLTVWDIVTKNQDVLDNSGWLSIELANEPVEILDKNGQNKNSGTTMRDFFQPIVNKIRENGFKGIIWVPGGTWQQDYRGYATTPVKDPLQNMGYAVHWYPGWYSTSDTEYNEKVSLNAFLSSVPVAKTNPIMITEVDWSPEDPNGQGHYNESGKWVKPNYGTWATGSTSKFGKAYKYVIDNLGNCGMTLTHTHDYMDIDYYLSTGKLRPAFSTKLPNNAWEACSGACFQWYKEYAAKEIKAREWIMGNKCLNDDDEVIIDPANLGGKLLIASDVDKATLLYVNDASAGPQDAKVGAVRDGEDNGYVYFKFTKVTNASTNVKGNIYYVQFANNAGQNYNLWGEGGYLNFQANNGGVIFALGLKGQNGQDGKNLALWKIDYEEGKGYVFQNVGRIESNQASYLNPSSANPTTTKQYIRLFTDFSTTPSGINQVVNDRQTDTRIYDLSGRMVSNPNRPGIYIRGGKKFVVK